MPPPTVSVNLVDMAIGILQSYAAQIGGEFVDLQRQLGNPYPGYDVLNLKAIPDPNSPTPIDWTGKRIMAALVYADPTNEGLITVNEHDIAPYLIFDYENRREQIYPGGLKVNFSGTKVAAYDFVVDDYKHQIVTGFGPMRKEDYQAAQDDKFRIALVAL